MKSFLLLPALSLLCLWSGCSEPQADISAPKTHRSGNITFDYPKNWTITGESITPEIHYFLMETPGDALVVFHSLPADEAVDLAAFSKTFAESAASETPIAKLVRTGFAVLPPAGGYDWIAEEFSVNLLGESVPHRRLYGAKKIGDRKVFLIFQVATEDQANTEPGFALFSETLRALPSSEPKGEKLK